jgi:hypothetical protein
MSKSILDQLDEALKLSPPGPWEAGNFVSAHFLFDNLPALIDVARAAQELKTTYAEQPRSLYGDMNKSQSMCNALGALFIQLAKLTAPEEK